MVYTFAAGQQPTADDLNAIFDQACIRKGATETVTSSTTLQNDDDFAVTLTPGVYLLWLWACVTGVEAGDIKLAWANTGTMAILRSSLGPATASTDRESTLMISRSNSSTTAQDYGVDTTGTTVIKEELYIDCTVGGDLTLQWAQNASNGTGTALVTSSRMWIVSVG